MKGTRCNLYLGPGSISNGQRRAMARRVLDSPFAEWCASTSS